MIIYLLKSGLCLLALLSFYKLVLENEKVHVFKRFYLLGSLAFSLVIPVVSLSLPFDSLDGIIFTSSGLELFERNVNSSRINSFPEDYSITIALSLIYLAGILFFGLRYFHNLRNILLKVRRNKLINHGTSSFVLLENGPAPHSFLKYIFLNKEDFTSGRIAQEIVDHELAHVDQKHSWDILLVEFLQVIFWCNPLFLLLKRSIRMNHEFLADQEIMLKKVDPYYYTNLLLSFTNRANKPSLCSSFYQSEVRKRITMISRSFSIKSFGFGLCLLIPTLGICGFLFSKSMAAEAQHISSQYKSKDAFYINAYLYGNHEIQIEDKKVTLDEVEGAVREIISNRQLDANEEVVYRIFADDNLQLGAVMDVEQKMYDGHNHRRLRLRKLLDSKLVPRD